MKFVQNIDLPSPDEFRRIGHWLLWSLLVVSFLAIAFLLWAAPLFTLAVPLAAAAVWILIILFRHPLLNLSVLLASFVVVADYEEGIQLREVVYGLYYMGFLAHFFVTRGLMQRERLFERPEERALFLFLIGITASIGLTLVWQGDFGDVISQWTALLLLLLYFPIKEAFVRYRVAPLVILLVIAWVGLFASARNLVIYQTMLSDASQLWQIATGRVVTNDGILMVAALTTLVVLLFADRWRPRMLFLGVFMATLAGLILTQSRGFWVGFVFGVVILLVFALSTTHRLRLLGFASAATVAGLVVGLAFFQDYLVIIIGGLIDRFGTLSTAFTDDISLVNRFAESRALLGKIMENPIVGYGMGVPYRMYDLITLNTREGTFVHNGFISIWYRFGLWGLLLLLFVYGSLIVRSARAMRADTDRTTRICATAALVSLVAYALPAMTSNPFHLNDGLFIYGVLFGIAGGTAARAERQTSG